MRSKRSKESLHSIIGGRHSTVKAELIVSHIWGYFSCNFSKIISLENNFYSLLSFPVYHTNRNSYQVVPFELKKSSINCQSFCPLRAVTVELVSNSATGIIYCAKFVLHATLQISYRIRMLHALSECFSHRIEMYVFMWFIRIVFSLIDANVWISVQISLTNANCHSNLSTSIMGWLCKINITYGLYLTNIRT